MGERERAPIENVATITALLVGVAVAALLIPGTRDFTADLAWLDLSHAKALRAGDLAPPSWRTRVSSPLWVLLLAAWPTAPAPVLPVKLLGALLHGLTAWLAAQLVLTLAISRASIDRPVPLLSMALLAGVLVATTPALVHGAASGTEVPLAAALVLGAAWALVDARPVAAAGLTALAVATRPAALAFVLVASAIHLRWPISPRQRRAAIAASVSGVIVLVTWILTSAIATGSSWAFEARGPGLHALGMHLVVAQPWVTGATGIALLAIAIGRDRTHARIDLAALLTAMLVAAIATALAGGSDLEPARAFAPLLACVPACLVFGLPMRPRWLGLALVLPIAIATGIQLAKLRDTVRSDAETVERRTTGVARFIADVLPRDAVIAVDRPGAIPFFAPAAMTIVTLDDPDASPCAAIRERATHLAITPDRAAAWAPAWSTRRLDAPAGDGDALVVLAITAVDPGWTERCEDP